MMYNFTTTTVIGISLLDINDRVIVDTDTLENNNLTILNYLCSPKKELPNTLKQISERNNDSTSTCTNYAPQSKS
jgi:hypothetical protein